jgi:hypothetical protein
MASGIAKGVTGSAENIPAIDRGEIKADFEDVLASSVQHFFIDTDTSGPLLAKEAAGLDPAVTTPESITQFLTLPTITARANPHKRLMDPVVDYTKSVMLTSNAYLTTMQQLQEKRNQAAMDKERGCFDKAESKCKKLQERKEEKRQREARALKMAEAQAVKALQR